MSGTAPAAPPNTVESLNTKVKCLRLRALEIQSSTKGRCLARSTSGHIRLGNKIRLRHRHVKIRNFRGLFGFP